MKAVNVGDALRKTPFAPFQLHVHNGAEIRIGHPENVIFNQSKTTAVIADGERFHIVDLDHISSLNFKRKLRSGHKPGGAAERRRLQPRWPLGLLVSVVAGPSQPRAE